MHADPHAHEIVKHYGTPVADARVVVLAVHGRGASADDILGLAAEFSARDVAYLAPQASARTWYPKSFLASMDENEPGLSSGLRRLGALVAELEAQGIAADRVALLGFSQGACLSLEFAARNARRYAAVAALSGGLIGPPGTPRDYAGSLDGTPVFLGCSDVDPHVPLHRVQESAGVFRRMQGAVEARVYRGMGHTINRDEIDAVDALLEAAAR